MEAATCNAELTDSSWAPANWPHGASFLLRQIPVQLESRQAKPATYSTPLHYLDIPIYHTNLYLTFHPPKGKLKLSSMNVWAIIVDKSRHVGSCWFSFSLLLLLGLILQWPVDYDSSLSDVPLKLYIIFFLFVCRVRSIVHTTNVLTVMGAIIRSRLQQLSHA